MTDMSALYASVRMPFCRLYSMSSLFCAYVYGLRKILRTTTLVNFPHECRLSKPLTHLVDSGLDLRDLQQLLHMVQPKVADTDAPEGRNARTLALRHTR